MIKSDTKLGTLATGAAALAIFQGLSLPADAQQHRKEHGIVSTTVGPDPKRVEYFDRAASAIAKQMHGKKFHFGDIGVLKNSDIIVEKFVDRSHSCNLPNSNDAFAVILSVRRAQEDLNRGEKAGSRLWHGSLFIEAKYNKQKQLESCEVKLYPGVNSKVDFARPMKFSDAKAKTVFIDPAKTSWEKMMLNAPKSKNVH